MIVYVLKYGSYDGEDLIAIRFKLKDAMNQMYEIIKEKNLELKDLLKDKLYEGVPFRLIKVYELMEGRYTWQWQGGINDNYYLIEWEVY